MLTCLTCIVWIVSLQASEVVFAILRVGRRFERCDDWLHELPHNDPDKDTRILMEFNRSKLSQLLSSPE